MEYNEAKKWYLKGFEDAELTERQPMPIEQTMHDAEKFFDLVWNNQKCKCGQNALIHKAITEVDKCRRCGNLK